MAVSFRLDTVLERELELAAKRQGVTKSQFIVDAVERSLGRKDPYKLLLEVRKEYGLDQAAPRKQAGRPKAAPKRPEGGPTKTTGDRVREVLRAKHDASMRDWLAYQKARKAGKTWSPDDTAA
jgi:predicted DNA-binding protein